MLNFFFDLTQAYVAIAFATSLLSASVFFMAAAQYLWKQR